MRYTIIFIILIVCSFSNANAWNINLEPSIGYSKYSFDKETSSSITPSLEVYMPLIKDALELGFGVSLYDLGLGTRASLISNIKNISLIDDDYDYNVNLASLPVFLSLRYTYNLPVGSVAYYIKAGVSYGEKTYYSKLVFNSHLPSDNNSPCVNYSECKVDLIENSSAKVYGNYMMGIGITYIYKKIGISIFYDTIQIVNKYNTFINEYNTDTLSLENVENSNIKDKQYTKIIGLRILYQFNYNG
jgi:hypothetical protein